MDEKKLEREEVEAVNVAEELLLKARRIRRVIAERVKEVLRLSGAPVVHAPGVESEGAAGLRKSLGGAEPRLPAAPAAPDWSGFLHPFARGLNHLLNHYLMVPVSQAEVVLDRPDLPSEVVGAFGQILDSCQKATRLMAELEDLAVVGPGETALVSLAVLVREFLSEQAAARPERDYELVLDLGDDEQAPVRVNRRMLRVMLQHLFTNAEQALLGCPRRQIEVCVRSTGEKVRCEIHDTGEGLPAEDLTPFLAPFFSTKGPFAHDTAHATLEAAGLGLTVCRHLLALHNGHLELQRTPGDRTMAAIVLPRAEPGPATALGPKAADLVRLDPAQTPREPHTPVESAPASEPPA